MRKLGTSLIRQARAWRIISGRPVENGAQKHSAILLPSEIENAHDEVESDGLGLEPDAIITYFGFNDSLKVAYRTVRDPRSDRKNAGLTDRELYE